MSEVNPYAPPESEVEHHVEEQGGGFWLEGQSLFLKEGARLPDVCLMTGKVSGGMSLRRQRFVWATSWRYAALLGILIHFWVGILLFVLAGFFLRQKIVFIYCLSQEAIRRDRRNRCLFWGSIGFLIMGVFLMTAVPDSWFGLISLLALLTALATSHFRRVLKPVSIRNGVAEFKNLHPEAFKHLRRWWRVHSVKQGTS